LFHFNQSLRKDSTPFSYFQINLYKFSHFLYKSCLY
jgi:hypothetical protein